MDIIVGFVAIVIVLALILWFNRNLVSTGRRPSPRRPGQEHPDTRFHAVSIEFASGACDAAKALNNKRFLSNEAPQLPLLDCNVSECECRFVHYDDRRGEDKRKKPNAPSLDVNTGENKEERRLRGECRSDGSDDYFS